ncbi:MAG TPA: SCO family protein [Steroidobacteraceae bacterium]
MAADHGQLPVCAVRRLCPALRLTAFLALAGCVRQTPFALQNITGLMPKLEFHLRDADARAVSAEDYRRKIVLLYFGYTSCPDVCPTTLAKLSQAVQSLGPQASNVRVLFVTVDPQRDTAAHLKSYVSYFGRQFVGLRGDDQALTELTRRYRVTYSMDPPDRNGNYSVEHSSAVFIFDQTGHPRLLAQSTDTANALAGDLRRLLRGD